MCVLSHTLIVCVCVCVWIKPFLNVFEKRCTRLEHFSFSYCVRLFLHVFSTTFPVCVSTGDFSKSGVDGMCGGRIMKIVFSSDGVFFAVTADDNHVGLFKVSEQRRSLQFAIY